MLKTMPGTETAADTEIQSKKWEIQRARTNEAGEEVKAPQAAARSTSSFCKKKARKALETRRLRYTWKERKIPCWPVRLRLRRKTDAAAAAHA